MTINYFEEASVKGEPLFIYTCSVEMMLFYTNTICIPK